MSFYDLIEQLRVDTLQRSAPAFLPELTITATIVVTLLARLPRWGHKLNACYIALVGSAVALYFSAPWIHLGPGGTVEKMQSVEIFTGMLVIDPLTVYFRSVLLLFALLFLVFTRLSGIPDREDSPDFYTLFLGATLGMALMASANHLLMVFLAVEMASVPSYGLAGILKGRRRASEAALKYSVYGAGASGVMLYGISLLAGALGTAHLPTMAKQLAVMSEENAHANPAPVEGAEAEASVAEAGHATAAAASVVTPWTQRRTVLMLGGLMVMVGLAFKLSAVPFHFWCPDVFEGAAAEVNAFLSVSSKAAAVALLVRVAVGLGHVNGGEPAQTAQAPAKSPFQLAAYQAPATESTPAQPSAAQPSTERAAASQPAHAPSANAATQQGPAVSPANAALAPVRHFMSGLIALLAAVTCTFGNLAAYGQTNIKRLLAYSTIAHAGYMMMPVAAAVRMAGTQPDQAATAVAGVVFYVGVYLFMNLGAFAIVAFLRNSLRSEEIADYAGLIRRSPGVVICFGVILFSLVGLPPLSGFAAKYVSFLALVPAEMYLLLFIGGLNTFFSLFYYLRVVKVMALDPEPESRTPFEFSMVSLAGAFIVLVTLPVVVLGIWWNSLAEWARTAAAGLWS